MPVSNGGFMNKMSHVRDTGWIVERSAVDQEAIDLDAALFALANGTLGVRGSWEEFGQSVSYLPQAYISRPIAYHESFPGFAKTTDTRVALPGPTAIDVVIDGFAIDFTVCSLQSALRTLDLREGVLRRHVVWILPDGRLLRIETERCIPIGSGPIALSSICVAAENFSGNLTLRFPIRASKTVIRDSVSDPRIDARITDSMLQQDAQVTLEEACYCFVDAHAQLALTIRQRLHSELPVRVVGTVQEIATVGMPGMAIRVDRSVSYETNGKSEIRADSLRVRHKQMLGAFWHTAVFNLEADADLACALRFNLFHIFQSAARSNTAGIAAKGLTGEGYEGHCFWDTEAFVVPVLALTAPALARHALMFRVEILNKARTHARALSHSRGALYPWRTIAGDECSAHYPTGSAQYHINAAIAYALEIYVTATGDDDFLFQIAAEMLFETARIWLEVGHFNSRRGGAFVINGVTGPDEYSALVDNDYYTNAMAQRHLRFACASAERMARTDPEAFTAVCANIGLTDAELALWGAAAQAMWLPVDARLKVSPQDDMFLDKPVFDFAALPREQFPLLLHHHPMMLFRHQLCKQGDVVQAMVMAGDGVPLTLKARNLAYYEPLTTHDSTLSPSAFGILAAETGAHDAAYAHHHHIAFVDLDNTHGNTGHGAHMAAMAGSWLMLAQGWAGLRIEEGHAWFRPRLMPKDSGYRFRLLWRSSLIEVIVASKGTSYQLIEGAPVEIYDHARKVIVVPGSVLLPKPEIDAIIFDLDGVLTNTATAHQAAWQQLCNEHDIAFDSLVNERLKGIDRAGSLQIILDTANISVAPERFDAMLAAKNNYYQKMITGYGPSDLFSGAHALLKLCQRAGLKLGLASASRNAQVLVERLGIASLFDHITDAALLQNSKPHPEIFLATAAAMGVDPSRCMGVEDAVAGIEAIHAAGMRSIGIGTRANLQKAEAVFAAIGDVPIEEILKR
jgi:beta-phosphoglucomutase